MRYFLNGQVIKSICVSIEGLAAPRLDPQRQGVDLARGVTIEEVQLESKDVADLGRLLYSLINGVSGAWINTNPDLPQLRDLEVSCPGAARIIRLSWCGATTTAHDFAMHVTKLDGEMNGHSRQSVDTSMTRSHFRAAGNFFSL